jgi:hypothetical protein
MRQHLHRSVPSIEARLRNRSVLVDTPVPSFPKELRRAAVSAKALRVLNLVFLAWAIAATAALVSISAPTNSRTLSASRLTSLTAALRQAEAARDKAKVAQLLREISAQLASGDFSRADTSALAAALQAESDAVALLGPQAPAGQPSLPTLPANGGSPAPQAPPLTGAPPSVPGSSPEPGGPKGNAYGQPSAPGQAKKTTQTSSASAGAGLGPTPSGASTPSSQAGAPTATSTSTTVPASAGNGSSGAPKAGGGAKPGVPPGQSGTSPAQGSGDGV